MCSPSSLIEDPRFNVEPGFRQMLVKFSVKFFQEMPDDVLKFSVEYFEELKKKKEISKDGLGYLRERRIPVFNKPDSDTVSFVSYPKSETKKSELKKSLRNIFLFEHLENEEVEELINALFPNEIKKGRYVVIQGQKGEFLFIIESGVYEVYIKDENGTKLVKTYNQKGYFGELSLLYDQPCAATIKCVSDGKLWALNGDLARRLMYKNSVNKRKKYLNLISSVPLLQALTSQEKDDLVDALKIKRYNNKTIIKEKEYPKGMHFITSGKVKVFKTDKGEKVDLGELNVGDYFGEMALIDNKRRSANVVAQGYVTTLFLETEAFERLLGPCMDILKRNMQNYDKIEHEQ